ncbi:MAG: 16S rRNA (guanine(527)-N(7))-methyltransferase RsmG [Catonella sp.]
MNDKSLIINKLTAEGIKITDVQCDKLYRFYEMVTEKNKVMNLTAITDYEEFVIKHFVDSLMIAKVMDMTMPMTVLDIGTGAGFPGVPVKIVYPETKVLLLDSLNKRLNFLNEVIAELGLKDITTIHSRAEELQAKGEYRENFDLCVSRAVSALPTLSEYCLPYVKLGGKFIAYKAVGADEEIEASKTAIRVLGGEIKETAHFTIKDTDYTRVLISIEKIKNTPKKYPRPGGKPGKNPLQ